MDIALAIESIIPAAQYLGSTTDNTKEAYESVSWIDTRIPKPLWTELKIAWNTAHQEEIKENRIQEIYSLLAEIDNKSIRPLRALALDDITEEDKQRLEELRSEAKVLREELQNLGVELRSVSTDPLDVNHGK